MAPREIDVDQVATAVRELSEEICYRVPPAMVPRSSASGSSPSRTSAPVRELEVDDLPAWVIHDCRGRGFYAEAARPWRRDDLLPAGLISPSDVDRGLGGGMRPLSPGGRR